MRLKGKMHEIPHRELEMRPLWIFLIRVVLIFQMLVVHKLSMFMDLQIQL
jgi:hypothetical protein